MNLLGLNLREHVGGRWSVSWAIVILWVPGALLAPLANRSTANPGTTSVQLLVASVMSFLPCVALLLLCGVTWMRHRDIRPLPVWAIAALGFGAGATRAASMYAVSVIMGIQAPDAYVAWTRILSNGVLGVLLYPLGVLFVSLIARYRYERHRLLRESASLEARWQRDAQQWETERRDVIAPVVAELAALGRQLSDAQLTALDATMQVRERSHALWLEARSDSVPRIRLWSAVGASLRRRPFATLMVSGLWFASTLGTVLSGQRGAMPVVALSVGAVIAALIFESSNQVVRRFPRTMWGVIPSALVLAALAASPLVEILGQFPPESRTTNFALTLAWLTSLTLSAAVIEGAISQGDAILEYLHDRVDAEAARNAAWGRRRRAALDVAATTLHGQLQSRLALADGADEAEAAIRETVSQLLLPDSESDLALNEAVEAAVRPWAALMTVTTSVTGECASSSAATVRDVVSEALSNSFRHGDAQSATVTVTCERDRVQVVVSDDGTDVHGPHGLGSRILDSAGDWSRERADGRTVLRVTMSG